MELYIFDAVIRRPVKFRTYAWGSSQAEATYRVIMSSDFGLNSNLSLRSYIGGWCTQRRNTPSVVSDHARSIYEVGSCTDAKRSDHGAVSQYWDYRAKTRVKTEAPWKFSAGAGIKRDLLDRTIIPLLARCQLNFCAVTCSKQRCRAIIRSWHYRLLMHARRRPYLGHWKKWLC